MQIGLTEQNHNHSVDILHVCSHNQKIIYTNISS